MKMNNKAIAAIGTLALAASLGLAACGGGGSSATAPGPPAGAAPTTTAPTSAAPVAAPADAVAVWQTTPQDPPGRGPDDVSNTFQAIAGDLSSTGQVPDPFTTQEAELNQLAAMSSLTGPQAQKDIKALDTFFQTPGLEPSGA